MITHDVTFGHLLWQPNCDPCSHLFTSNAGLRHCVSTLVLFKLIYLPKFIFPNLKFFLQVKQHTVTTAQIKLWLHGQPLCKLLIEHCIF